MRSVETDFLSALHTAGLKIDDERYQIMLEAFREFKAYLAKLDLMILSYGDEPALVLNEQKAPE